MRLVSTKTPFFLPPPCGAVGEPAHQRAASRLGSWTATATSNGQASQAQGLAEAPCSSARHSDTAHAAERQADWRGPSARSVPALQHAAPMGTQPGALRADVLRDLLRRRAALILGREAQIGVHADAPGRDEHEQQRPRHVRLPSRAAPDGADPDRKRIIEQRPPERAAGEAEHCVAMPSRHG